MSTVFEIRIFHFVAIEIAHSSSCPFPTLKLIDFLIPQWAFAPAFFQHLCSCHKRYFFGSFHYFILFYYSNTRLNWWLTNTDIFLEYFSKFCLTSRSVLCFYRIANLLIMSYDNYWRVTIRRVLIALIRQILLLPLPVHTLSVTL